MGWRVKEVIQEGSLHGDTAGQTIKLRVRMPWGKDELFECAPNFSKEDIERTIESRIRDHENPPPPPVVSGDELIGLGR